MATGGFFCDFLEQSGIEDHQFSSVAIIYLQSIGAAWSKILVSHDFPVSSFPKKLIDDLMILIYPLPICGVFLEGGTPKSSIFWWFSL